MFAARLDKWGCVGVYIDINDCATPLGRNTAADMKLDLVYLEGEIYVRSKARQVGFRRSLYRHK